MNLDWLDPDTIKKLVDGAAVLKPIKEGLDIVKQVKDILAKRKDTDSTSSSEAQLRELVTELTNRMLSAQEAEAALRARMLEILSELSRLQQFENERDGFVMVALADHSYAFRAKGHEADQSAVSYCAHCFEQSKRKVTLQMKQMGFGRDILQCSVCKGEVFQSNNRRAEALPIRRNPGGIV